MTRPHKSEAERALPCPFCGEEPIVSSKSGAGYVACSNERCHVAPQSEAWFPVETAIKHWNTRRLSALRRAAKGPTRARTRKRPPASS